MVGLVRNKTAFVIQLPLCYKNVPANHHLSLNVGKRLGTSIAQLSVTWSDKNVHAILKTVTKLIRKFTWKYDLEKLLGNMAWKNYLEELVGSIIRKNQPEF